MKIYDWMISLMTMLKKGFFLSLLTLLIDFLSKYAVVKYFSSNSGNVEVTSFFNISLVYNKGISFGLFNNLSYSNYLFCFVSVFIIGFLLGWMKKTTNSKENIALGLIIGGAIGNVIDRIIYPGVVDFLEFHWKGYYWPSFNVADSAICVGVCILLIFGVKSK
jgi:signal peptidase II